MLNVGGGELLIILLVALVFLGPQRLPEVARQLGQAASSLRSLASGFQAEIEAASRPDTDSSMRLKGPTSQREAIAKTQNEQVAGSHPSPGTPQNADAAAVAKAAREVNHDAAEKPVSSGGPKDLRAETVDTAGKVDDASGDDG